MKLMSFSATTAQCWGRTKTETTRNDWVNLQPGELIQQIEKGQGLPKGAHVKKIHVIQIVSTRFEPLDKIITCPEYGRRNMIREGFPDMDPADFVEMYCKMNSCKPNHLVNRISFRYYLTPTPDLTLRVPANVCTCPDCQTQMTVAPDGWYLDTHGTMACNSFSMWCDSEVGKDEQAYNASHSKSLSMPFTYWATTHEKITEYLKDHFRFEIGADGA